MRIRFIARDVLPDGPVEVAIDDVKIEFTGCPGTNPADLNNDNALDINDVSIFLNAYESNNPIIDFNTDGQLDFFDVSAFLIQFSQGLP